MEAFHNKPANKPDRLCPISETMGIVGGLSKSGIYDKVARGTFPKPISLGPKRVAWSFNELQDWIAGRKVAA